MSLFKVSLSRKGGLCPGSLCLGVPVLLVSVQKGVPVQKGSLSGRGSLSRGVSVKGGLCPRESLSRVSLSRVSLSRVSVPGVFFQEIWVSVRGVSVRENPCTVMNGQYASYWNAFLCTVMCAQYNSAVGRLCVCPGVGSLAVCRLRFTEV